VFYRGNKVWVVLAHLWSNSCAPVLVPIFYYRDKTRYRCFIS